MNIGHAVKVCRIQKGLTLADLAERASISVSYLSLLERGKRDPNWSTVESIADGLAIPVSILVFLASDKAELPGVRPEVSEKLAQAALNLMKAMPNEGASI